VELPDSIISLLEDYRLAKGHQDQANRAYAAANRAFVRTRDAATRDALDARMDALTCAARAVAGTAVCVAEALDSWDGQHKGASVGKVTADLAPAKT
jgi:hypothetical protein